MKANENAAMNLHNNKNKFNRESTHLKKMQTMAQSAVISANTVKNSKPENMMLMYK